MQLEKLLKEINFQKEIIKIFKKIEPKKENLNILRKEFLEYKIKKNEKQRKKFKYSKNLSSAFSWKLDNIHKVLVFIEEMLLNSCEAIEHDFENNETIDKSKITNDFINDWNNIDEILPNFSSQEEILETSTFLQEYISSINNYQTPTNQQSKSYKNGCLIL